MIRYLYGEDTYSVAAVAAKIVADFVEKQASDLNVNTIEASRLTLENFADATLSAPFLGDKKLTVVKNLIVEKDSADLRKKLIVSLDKLPATSEILFVDEGKPDARDALYKFLLKNAKCKYYAPVDEVKLRRFITAKTTELNMTVSNQAAAKLSFFVGPDLWRLQNEILKLAAFAQAQSRTEISAEDIELLVEPNINLKIFDLTDALAARNSVRAIQLLDAFIQNDEDLMMVFNLVIYQFRNMIVIKDLIERKERDIGKSAGLHPFVVRKTEQAVRKIEQGQLVSFYRQLEDYDYGVKTGKLGVEDALILLFVDFCKNGKMR